MMVPNKPNEGPIAVLVGILSACVSWLVQLNWIALLGLGVSAGWLFVGAVRLRWEQVDRREARAATAARPGISRPDIAAHPDPEAEACSPS